MAVEAGLVPVEVEVTTFACNSMLTVPAVVGLENTNELASIVCRIKPTDSSAKVHWDVEMTPFTTGHWSMIPCRVAESVCARLRSDRRPG